MATVLISGANRGLGLEFVRQYLADNWNVIATCRDPQTADELTALKNNNDALDIVHLDVGDFTAIDRVAKELEGRSIDVLLNNAGIFGPKPNAENDLRQNFGSMDYNIFANILRVNTIAPLKMAEALQENVLQSEQKKIVTISSQVGSIDEGTSTLLAYPTSKAAVNMTMSALARVLASQGGIVSVMNPGWVKTRMGGQDAKLEVEESVTALRQRIAELTMEHSGSFIDYDGRIIPW